ncbi:MAG: uncharacterized protein A8A55_2448 [Amphiamblys sp. WSBS2006]|nr:MAG: uncharacterized protein A8A55_2448 [Amphiamblys sp. WSBS2006]
MCLGDDINSVMLRLMNKSFSTQETEAGNLHAGDRVLDQQTAAVPEDAKELEEEARLYAAEQEEREQLNPGMPAFGPPARQTTPFAAIDEIFQSGEIQKLLNSTE